MDRAQQTINIFLFLRAAVWHVINQLSMFMLVLLNVYLYWVAAWKLSDIILPRLYKYYELHYQTGIFTLHVNRCLGKPQEIDAKMNPSISIYSTFLLRNNLGLYSLRRRRLTGIGIPIINLRRSDDRLRFIMGIPILIRRRLLSE